MGWIRHHVIIVTSWNRDLLARAHDVATDGLAYVSRISETATNGYHSFCVFPDGSKEGWEESNIGDRARDAFVEWLRAQRYEDGSTSLQWAEIEYGELVGPERMGAAVTRHFGDEANDRRSADPPGDQEK